MNGAKECDKDDLAAGDGKECGEDCGTTDGRNGCAKDAFPYDSLCKVGQVLELKAVTHGDATKDDRGSTIQAYIRKIISRTFCMTAVVDIDDGPDGSCCAFLKTYDWCSSAAQKQNGAKTWTHELEADYIAAVENGDPIIRLMEDLREETDDQCSDGEDEEPKGNRESAEENFEWKPPLLEAGL